MINKISHHSISSALKFKNCAYSWWIEKVLGQKLPSSSAASFGSQFDQVVAHKLGLEPSDTRGDDVPITEQTLCAGVEDAANNYLIQPFAVTKEGAKSAQKKILITPDEWAMMGEVLGLSLTILKPIIGYIDLVEQIGIARKIVDLKTSSRKGGRSDWALQIILYCLAEQCPRGEVHLMTTTKVPAFYKYPVLMFDEHKRWAMSTITSYVNNIEKALIEGSGENLPRNPDYWCGWCADHLECPAKGAIIG